jgi:hypothetical protein
MFFYRLGHQPNLSLSELQFKSKENFSQEQDQPKVAVLKSELAIRDLGGSVYSGKVVGFFDTPDQLAQLIYDLNLKHQFKKIGLSIFPKFKSKIIDFCHQIGIKKINLLLDVEPNFGHFQNHPWLIVYDLQQVTWTDQAKTFLDYSDMPKSQYCLCFSDDVTPQDTYIKLDSAPAGNMRRGRMNLKLAKILLSFSRQGEYVWDPFCGQVGLLLVNAIFGDKPSLGTDIDRAGVKANKENLAWLQSLSATDVELKITHPVLHLERLDATKLAHGALNSNIQGVIQKTEPNFKFKSTVIVTEGTLGPTYAKTLPDVFVLRQNLAEISKIWSQVFAEATSLEIQEIIFCLPFYRTKEANIRVNLDEIDFAGYELQTLLFQDKSLDYHRNKSLVGHEIFKAVLVR